MKEQNHLRETENKMFIDLHLHESAYSPDSQMTLDELVQAAREKRLISAAELGYLEQYESPEAEADAGYRDKDGYWTGLALVPAGFLVNNDVLKEKGLEAPKTWEDLSRRSEVQRRDHYGISGYLRYPVRNPERNPPGLGRREGLGDLDCHQ